jgi:hypothetical protein
VTSSLLQHRAWNDHRLADEQGFEVAVLAHDDHPLVFELPGKDPIDGGGIAQTALDALDLDRLVADDLQANIVPLLVQAEMLQPEQYAHPAGAADAGDTESLAAQVLGALDVGTDAPDVAESYLKGEIEALVFSLAPKNKPIVLKTLARWLKVDASGAEDAYLDLVRGVDRKPFASLEGLRNAQRLLRTRNPKVGEVKPEDVIDNRLMRKLEDSGFIDKLYATYGASPK